MAYLLLSASVVLGLATTTRLARVRGLHERIALLALGAVAAHGLLLLPDGWLHPGLLRAAGPVHARLPAGVDRPRDLRRLRRRGPVADLLRAAPAGRAALAQARTASSRSPGRSPPPT